MRVAIVKYNAGNIQSVSYALNRLGIEPIVTNDPDELYKADKIIFPGVGDAGTAMPYLRERGLDSVLVSLKQPFLGICFGMQLMCKHSEEGDVDCLGIFDVNVKRFPSGTEKVPHMGWNNISFENGACPLLAGIKNDSDVYFVHSFVICPSDSSVVKASAEYGIKVPAVIQSGNIYACQFHPEKSGEEGLKILKNFCTM